MLLALFLDVPSAIGRRGTVNGFSCWKHSAEKDVQGALEHVPRQNLWCVVSVFAVREDCKHVPKVDLSWFHVEEGAPGKKASKTMTGVWCASCGQRYRHDEYGCVITMQHIPILMQVVS